MDMSNPATRYGKVGQDSQALSNLDPRRISPVTPPPVVVVYKGWWNDHTTRRQAADLEREDREQRQRT